MSKVPPWMWLVGGLCLGALGYAALTFHLALLGPAIFLALGLGHVLHQQRNDQVALEAAEKKREALEEAELNRQIYASDELEAKFKALEAAMPSESETLGKSATVVDSKDDRIVIHGASITSMEDLWSLLQNAEEGLGTIERPLSQTVRGVVLKGNVGGLLRRRPGRHPLQITGSLPNRRRVQVVLADEILHITFPTTSNPEDGVRIELSSAALESVAILGPDASTTIVGEFQDLTVVARNSGALKLEGSTEKLRLNAEHTTVDALKFDAVRTELVGCRSSLLGLYTQNLEGSLHDNQVHLRTASWKVSIQVDGSFASVDLGRNAQA